MRIGIGYDVHRLVPRRKLVLGGIEVPFDKGLIGWSDADALVHAVIDALLGAAGMGDIGKHFPSGDPKYMGVSSLNLLAEVKTMLINESWRVVNIDGIIVAEQPKLEEYIGGMCSNLAELLDISADRINIKANTSEALGFVGREEGIATWVVVLLEKES